MVSIIINILMLILCGFCVFFSCKLKDQFGRYLRTGTPVELSVAKCSSLLSLIYMLINAIALGIVAGFLIFIGILSIFWKPENDAGGFGQLFRLLGMIAGAIGVALMAFNLIFIGQVINICKFRNKGVPFVESMANGAA